jgi:4-hydroxybenzoate polyprenyltransferase
LDVKRFFSSSLKLLKSRLEVLFIWSWSTTIACLIVGKGVPPLLPTVKSIISVLFVTASVYVYNDVIDVEADKYNTLKRNRPLPTGQVDLVDAKLLVALTCIIGLLIGYTINLMSFSFLAIYFLVFGAYSYPGIHLKRRFLIKEIVISSGPIITSFIGSYAIASSLSYPAVFAAGLTALLGMVIQPGLNDSTDIEADKLQGIKTLAIALSWKHKMQMLIGGIIIVMVTVPFVYWRFGFNVLFPFWIVVGGLITLRYILPIAKAFDESPVLKARRMVIIYWALMQVFSVLGTLSISILP